MIGLVYDLCLVWSMICDWVGLLSVIGLVYDLWLWHFLIIFTCVLASKIYFEAKKKKMFCSNKLFIGLPENNYIWFI